MKQRLVNENAGLYTNDENGVKPPSFIDALWQLPRQYFKVMCRPSVQTFNEEKGNAGWGIVLFQFYLLVVITVVLNYLAHFIPGSTLHAITAMQVNSTQPFHLLPSPYNAMTFILASFFIGLGTAYLFSRLWSGQGTFLAHTYCLLLSTVPLVTVSGLLLLIPGTGGLVAMLICLVFFLFIYRMVLHGLTIMAVHELNGGKATLIVLIIPMLVVSIVLLLFTAEWLGIIFEGFGGMSDGRERRKKVVK